MASPTKTPHSSLHFWLREETKPNEGRAPLTPQACKDLLNSGFKVTVERSQQRIFADEEYGLAGCTLVSGGKWRDAPSDAFILGIKELPQDSFPLTHKHIYFGHVYKNQEGWKDLLNRFKAGGGALLDVEYMCYKNGRRAVAEFSPLAGAAGAALGVELWTHQHLKKPGEYSTPYQYPSEEEFVKHLRSCLKEVWQNDEEDKHRPRVLVMGALGRCGKGATRILVDEIGLPKEQVVEWDMKETAAGGPFHEILDFDVFVNCIFLSPTADPIPPFLRKNMLATKNRNLAVVVDVSCDTSNPDNPLPFITDITTFSDPVRTIYVGEGAKPLRVIAIDHLPSLLPREASTNFCSKMVLQLPDLANMEKSDVWMSAFNTFQDKCKQL
eukprot:gene12780-14091_t